MPVKPASFLVMGVMLLYPVAVYVGLNSFEPRVFGLLLVGMLLLRQRSLVRRFAASLSVGDWWVFMGLAAFALFVAIGNSERLLLLYPAVVSLALLLLFARSLFYPPTMIERIARLSEPDLPPAGVRYTYHVTQVWCLFFVFNATVAVATVFSSREAWLLYNGLLSYLLMGGLFLGEWLVRARVRRSTR
jgi:uncharacterized membrane protein